MRVRAKVCVRAGARLSAESALWLSRWVGKRLAELLAKPFDSGVVAHSNPASSLRVVRSWQLRTGKRTGYAPGLTGK